jgi:tetratricopeptide (TPR) repeat protein
MSIEVQDRDAIVSKVIEIVSAEERDAFIAQACGDDEGLRRQVEEMVAAHLETRSNSDKPAVTVDEAHPVRRDWEQVIANHAEDHEKLLVAASRPSKGARKTSRRLAIAAALLLLVVAGVGGASLAVWAWRAEERARTAVRQAAEERDQARKSETEVKHQLDQVEAARHATAKERDQALEAAKEARDSAEVTKAVLAFLNDKMLTAGRPMGWSGGQGKDVTLRQAVDAAESKVAGSFADQPLAEASVRETLGSTYLDLEEAKRAVKQFERALALRESLLGPDAPATGDCRNKLAVAYRLAGRTDEAGRLFDRNPHSSSHASALAVRGSMLLSQKKPVEAERKLRECLAIREKIQPDDWTTFDATALLGEALLEQKKYTDAEPLLLSGYKGMKEREAKIPSADKVRLTQALERLVRLYEVWGKNDKVAKWRKELEMAEASKKS